MKLPYMKPEFGQILLAESYPKNCDIESSFDWAVCQVPIGTSGPFNRPVVVFTPESSCTVGNQGNTNSVDGSYICYFTGVSTSVFGS